jgi:serine protease Do
VAEDYRLGERKGVLVYQVLPDSPASKAGVKDGDIVAAFDGQPIQHSRQLIDLVSGTKAGRRITLEILREGKSQTLEVEIGARPVDVDLAEAGRSGEAWRGLKVGPLAPEQLERLGLEAGTTGVLIVEVASGSPAEQAGLHEGDVINEIKGAIKGQVASVRIESVGDFNKVTAELKGNALVRTNRGYVVIKAAP